jgi:hypothetical protein
LKEVEQELWYANTYLFKSYLLLKYWSFWRERNMQFSFKLIVSYNMLLCKSV